MSDRISPIIEEGIGWCDAACPYYRPDVSPGGVNYRCAAEWRGKRANESKCRSVCTLRWHICIPWLCRVVSERDSTSSNTCSPHSVDDLEAMFVEMEDRAHKAEGERDELRMKVEAWEWFATYKLGTQLRRIPEHWMVITRLGRMDETGHLGDTPTAAVLVAYQKEKEADEALHA